MELINTILSILASIVSIIMAIVATREKQQCIKIKNEIDNSYKSIESNDEFNINKVSKFDNRKIIR